MSKLYFRLGRMKGFTSSELADKKEGYANPIRELLQNSLDASREADNAVCEINICIETIPKSKIPHINEYENILGKTIQTTKNRGGYNPNVQQRVASIKKALEQEEIKVLMLADNGKGMQKKQLDGLLDEVSIKDDETGSGGSFGVGSLSSYSLSSLRYVLYATKYDDNGTIKPLYTGSPILAGYIDDDGSERGNRGVIVKEKPVIEKAPDLQYPEEFPDFIKPRMDKLDKGTMVVILGLSEQWDDEAKYAIASNFFHALAYGSLTIKFNIHGQETAIDIDEIERLLLLKKDSRRAHGEMILSGEAVYEAWRTVKDKGTQEEIDLSNGDKVHVYIKNCDSANSVIALVRNGMLIARHDSMLSNDMNMLRKNRDFDPFTAIIDVDLNAKELLGLVKNAESPYHNRLQRSLANSDDIKRLQTLLRELSGEIEKKLKKIDRESFKLPLFEIANAEAVLDGGSKARGQKHTAHVDTDNTRNNKNKRNPTTGSRKNRLNPDVISRNLDAKNSSRYIDKGDKYKIMLKVVPNQMDAKDNVYLSIHLGQDSDKNIRGDSLKFTTISINDGQGERTLTPDKKGTALLGKLLRDKQYDIVAEVEKPAHISDMKVSLVPIFGLKQESKTDDEKNHA